MLKIITKKYLIKLLHSRSNLNLLKINKKKISKQRFNTQSRNLKKNYKKRNLAQCKIDKRMKFSKKKMKNFGISKQINKIN